MWEQLCSLPAGERASISNKLIRSEQLSFDDQVTFEAAFHIAYNRVHGED